MKSPNMLEAEGAPFEAAAYRRARVARSRRRGPLVAALWRRLRARRGQARARHADHPAGLANRKKQRAERLAAIAECTNAEKGIVSETRKVEIHTDGACSGNPGPGGWGAVLRWNGHCKELYGRRTRHHQQPRWSCGR